MVLFFCSVFKFPFTLIGRIASSLKPVVRHPHLTVYHFRYFFVAPAHIEAPKYMNWLLYVLYYHKLLERKNILCSRIQTSDSVLSVLGGNVLLLLSPDDTEHWSQVGLLQWEGPFVQLRDSRSWVWLAPLQQKCVLYLFCLLLSFSRTPRYPEKKLNRAIL